MLWDLYDKDGSFVRTSPQPHSIHAGGRWVSNPTVAQLNEAGWYGQDYRKPVDADLVVDGWRRVGVMDGRSVYEPSATHSAKAVAATDFAKKVATYGTRVGILANLLAMYGLTIPTDFDAVCAHIEALVSGGTVTDDQLAIVGILKATYESLDPVRDDIAAIWEVVKP